MDRRTEPPIWPPDESEIPEENEIPERRWGSSGFLFSGGTCARDGLAYAAGLALSVSHRLDCGSSARRINRQTGSSPAPFGHQVLWPLDSAGAPVGGGIFQEKLVVARTLFARSRGKQPDSFDQRIVIRPSPGHECSPLGVAEAFGGCALLRRSRRVGVGIERRALYATGIRKANHGTLTNPLFRCVIVSVPAFCHWSERSPLGPSCCNL
jgi:hypothetical protein